MYGISWGTTIEVSNPFFKRYWSARATASFTPDSLSSIMGTALNFLLISNAFLSFVTIMILSIWGEIDKTPRISSNIISQIFSFCLEENPNLVFAREKVFTGIIAAVFKLNVNLF